MKALVLPLLLGIVVAFVASVPYFYGFLYPHPGFLFLPRSVVNSADTFVYVSHIYLAKDGFSLLPNLYSTESLEPFIVRPIYVLLGVIARIGNVDPLFMYHAGRFIFTIFFCFFAWRLVGVYFKTVRSQLLAFFVLIFSSGFGFFLQFSKPIPIDLWVPESNTFFSLLEAPHFVMVQTAFVASFYFLTRYLDTKKFRFLFFSSLAISLLIPDYPYSIPFVFLFYPTTLLFTSDADLKKRFLSIIYFLALPIFVTASIYFVSFTSANAQLWYKQNILPSPPLIAVFAGYGLVGWFAVNTAIFYFNKRYLPLILWIGVALVFTYFPISIIPFQRRLLTGLHIPLALLATVALIHLAQKLQSRILKGVFLLFTGGALIATTVFNITAMIEDYNRDTTISYKHHIRIDELAAMQWIAQNTKQNDIILTHPFYGNIIPAFTGRFVYIGHQFQTINFKNKFAAYTSAMKQDIPDEFHQLLKESAIAYVYIGQNDWHPQWLVSPAEESFFTIVWHQGEVFILKVL